MLALQIAAAPLEPKRVTTAEFSNARQPRIALDANGTIHIAFGMDNAIYTTRSANNGDSFTPPVKVDELDTLALGMRRGPRIATAGQAVVITAISHADGNLHSWRSADGGRTWTKTENLNDVPKSAAEGLHDLASDGERKLAAVWLDLRSGKTELWTSVSQDAGKTWTPNTRVYRSPDQTICECCHASVTFTPGGDIAVMWRNWLDGSRDMYWSKSSDAGKSFSTAAKLGTGTWKLQACPMDGGSLAATETQVSFAWRREGKLYFSDAPAREHLLAESGTHPLVLRHGSAFACVWQDQGHLFWKKPAAKEPKLLARDAAFAAHATTAARDASLLVWEGKGGIFFCQFPP